MPIPEMPGSTKRCEDLLGGVLGLLNTMVASESRQSVPFGRKEHLKILVFGSNSYVGI